MAKLSNLTDPRAVREAIAEFSERGREQFLLHYKHEGSRDYFVEFDGALFDSKPIVAAAYGWQHPTEGPLAPSDFSGGTDGAARALRRLGFQVVTRAQLTPPQLGDQHPDRTAIYERYGGVKVQGIMRFPGEDVVNVFSDADGPYADDPPTLTESFGYRGEGLNGDQRLTSPGNSLLEGARTQRAPVRFWHRPRGGSFTFEAWAAVLGRAWVRGIGLDRNTRAEIEWQLRAVAGQEPTSWPADVLEELDESESVVDQLATVPVEAEGSPTYSSLLARVDHLGQPRRSTGVVRTNFRRSAAARRAVLQRCGGMCENPHCAGMPAELDYLGRPILDVDHIVDLALKGDDHPMNMIALCPNCHAVKTRGVNVVARRRMLLQVARAAHERAQLID